MDQLISQGQWWWLFPVPLLTFIFAIAGSWWGSRLGRTTEHKQWLRNEKLKVYLELDVLGLDLVRALSRSPASPDEGIPGALNPLLAFERIPVEFVASKPVQLAYSGVVDAVAKLSKFAKEPGRPNYADQLEKTYAAVAELRRYLRKDLKISD